ncbi:MAG: M23 family metallopeptidase [Gammaproteobacteria bacterium]|nr:M23 family metallopeptidase [Gammaproteobacteria bacterium]MDH3429599.1 M23 family metallopeptidase [Gammaproteobacteria bacterium]MDH3434317.1 M23 family metallopeptidase [Gammaproteobacteria bacterium]
MHIKVVLSAWLLLASGGLVFAQSLYKYRGADGEWIYSDRPPDDGTSVEIRQLETARQDSALSVTHEITGRTAVLTAHNQYFAPVELVITIQRIRGLQYPDPDSELRWVVPPRSDLELMGLELMEDAAAPFLEYQYQYLAGEPNARHQPQHAYRAPFAIASSYPVSQAYPEVSTHNAPDSYYAVDLAMPIGTDVVAARGGIVFDVASSNFRGGLDAERDGPAANVVRIVHDDGTYALYAHLNTNSIRVRPGDRVERGEYIADSGNTGFSSGPHLHFAVMRNVGLRIESLPFEFMGANATAVVPAAGMTLTAY